MALTVEVAVFVNTNLGTRMAMDVSPDITARDLKRELETQHFNCFWNSGEIRVSRLMVKRKSCLYHLPDSVPMKSVFRGVKGTWFLHVEARFLSDRNRPCLPKYAASKPEFSITHPLHPENIVTSIAKSNTKGHCKRMLREKLFRCHNPLLGKLRRPFYFTKIRKRRKKISSAYEVNRVQIDKEKFPDCASKSMIDEHTHTSSEVVSVSGIIHRYFSNLSEDGGPSSPTRSVTSRVVQSWPEEHLKTKADDICSSTQVSPLTQFSAKRTAKPVCLPSPTGYGQRRYKLNKPEVGKRLVVASYSLGISPSKEHPAISLQLRRLDSFTQSSKNTTFFPLPPNLLFLNCLSSCTSSCKEKRRDNGAHQQPGLPPRPPRPPHIHLFRSSLITPNPTGGCGC
ncbi:PREDICTED: pectinesterase [Prunus dulcis]|uniref:PREDICTED: pectinesterase n=1 Tax=Prunus dulcis TaxID=3755 RepID=A0A5E4FBI6_PRUDU|nr:hypothetical protein L3X38_045540 [Prunus dulcis]VVA25297.1 PREDICTED: pectinesterase [Prunus dulcis]